MPPPKICLTVKVFKPPRRSTASLLPIDEIALFKLPVAHNATFSRVWELAQQRFKENYRAGRINDYFFRKIQDSTGADIDLRDTVIDIFGAVQDPKEHVIQILQLPLGRDDTAPVDSHLHPPVVPPTPEELEEINRRRSELDRYGATLDDLDPDQPVESHEAPVERRVDQDGFAIPEKIIRPPAAQFPPSSRTVPSSQIFSQNSYENHLVRSPELGSPQRDPPATPHSENETRPHDSASQYSTLDAVPSAQKPPKVHQVDDHLSAFDSEANNTDLDAIDPISEDSQPRLSSSAAQISVPSTTYNKRKSLDSSESHHMRTPKPSGLWSEDEKDMLKDGLAKGLSHADIKQRHFPSRSVEAIRKKSIQIKKDLADAITQRNASLNPVWTQDEEEYFIHAVRKDWSWQRLHDHRFLDRSDDSVRIHLAEVRQRLRAEETRKSARRRYQDQLRHGSPSTGPNEKFTQEESDFLLACRIENVEMKRVAKEFFPLRPQEQVINRAGTLLQNAKRAAAKANPMNLSRSPSVEFLFEHDAVARDRIAVQQEKARAFKKESSRSRIKESEVSSRQKSMIRSDKERAEERRATEIRNRQILDALEDANKQDQQVKRRRLNEDLRRESEYKRQMAAWEQQAELDTQAGRQIQPRPTPPLGSSIGTEVLSTTRASRLKSTEKETTPGSLESGPSTTSHAAEQGTKRRRSSLVEVQVVIPALPKKRKIQPTDGANPQSDSVNKGAANTSRVSAASTPKRPAPLSSHSAMAKVSSIREPSNTQSSTIDTKPPVRFASISAARPTRRSTITQTAKDDISRNLLLSDLPTTHNLRQSKLPFLRNGQPISRPSTQRSTDAPSTPRINDAIDDSVFISSDEESSYDDEEITDAELNAMVERSEAMYSSSPIKAAPEPDVKVSVNDQQKPKSSGVSAMRSSPPVASMPSPDVKPVHVDAALQSATKLGLPPSSMLLSVSSAPAELNPNDEHKESFIVSSPDIQPATVQEDEVSELEMSTAEAGVLGNQENDTTMLPADHIAHAPNSTPVFPSSSQEPEGHAEPGVAPYHEQDILDSSVGREELIHNPADNRQTGSWPQQASDTNVLRNLRSADQGSVSISDRLGQTNPHSDSNDVEDIKCWRSDSADDQIDDGDWPGRGSDEEMLFPKAEIRRFGPFTVPETKRTTHINAAVRSTSSSEDEAVRAVPESDDTSLAEQAGDILKSPSVTRSRSASSGPAVEKPLPLYCDQPRQDIGSFTSSAAGFTVESSDAESHGVRPRRGMGKQRKHHGSRVLADAHLSRPPPATVSDSASTGLVRGKRPKQNNQEKLSKETNGAAPIASNTPAMITSSSAKRDKAPSEHLKPKRRSLGLDESLKNLLEKGQAFGAQSQDPTACQKSNPNKPAATQPATKAIYPSITKISTSSQPQNSRAGRAVNPKAFDWDNAQDTAGLIRRSHQRFVDAANMPSQEFWKESTLKTMNEEQVLTHMIANGVKKRLADSGLVRNDTAAGAEQSHLSTSKVPATQPLQRSTDATDLLPGQSNYSTPRPATQPVGQTIRRFSDIGSSSSSDDDSDEEDLVESLENLAKRAMNTTKSGSLPNW